LDVGAAVCCDNSEYCIIGLTGASCCAIGSDCSNDTPCNSLEYFCPGTATFTVGTATTTGSCCARSCPSTSAYKCASSYGGGCCSFDSQCGSNNACVPLSTSTSAAVVSEIPSGCTTNQIACPTSLGGGCCDNTLTCTVISNTNFCAAPAGTAIRTGTNGILETSVPQSSSGLSTGAKAGIGAGLAVVACLVAGLLLWFCVLHRRQAAMQSTESGSNPRPAMSQASGSAAPMARRATGQQAADYFGPAAIAGPYTSDHTSAVTSPATDRGVPVSPQSPGDIQVPVEIDSRGHSTATSPGNFEYWKSPKVTEPPVELP